MKKKALAILMISLFSVFFCSAVPKSTQSNKSSKIVIEGYIVSKGNMPFVFPVIETIDEKEYTIAETSASKKQKLLNLQGNLIRFTGTLEENGSFKIKKYKIIKSK